MGDWKYSRLQVELTWVRGVRELSSKGWGGVAGSEGLAHGFDHGGKYLAEAAWALGLLNVRGSRISILKLFTHAALVDLQSGVG